MDEAVSERALRESEELHRITLLNMPDAVFITRDDGVFTYVCPNVDVIFGYRQDEVQAMNQISRLLGRELIERAWLVESGEARNVEHEIVTKGGTRRSLLTHIKEVAIREGTTLYVCRDITERRQSEQKLRRNEERLTLALQAASMGTWDWDVPTGEMDWSPETHRIFGDDARTQTPSFDSFLDRVHPADRDRVFRTMANAMDRAASYETHFRVRGYDEVERWVMGKGKAWKNGKLLRMLGVFVDFTEHHHAAEELSELSGRLIHAYEQERIRLSRELHDDVAQQVSLLAAEVSLLHDRLRHASADVRQEIEKLSAHIEEIGSGLHRVAHELHPARLAQLGLADSIRIFCREMADVRRISIRVEIAGIPSEIESNVALCLYRITQEALQNVVKHSRASRAIVALAAARNEILLTVIDDGAGFDPMAVRQKATLGLVSMRERARLMRGQLVVTSKPGAGTWVEALVPFKFD